jgi:hypothetical protein
MATLRIPPPGAEERLPRFDTTNVLWFFGAIATASASNGVLAAVSPSARGTWILLVALAFAAVYAGLSFVLRATGWWVPGGLFATIVVTLVPAAGVGFERLIGVWPGQLNQDGPAPESFQGAFFALALATMVVGLFVCALVRFEFVLLVVTVAALVTAQLFLPAVVEHPSADDASTTAIVSGALLVLVGLLLDRKGKRRVAFWFHVVGLAGVAIGLTYFAGSQGDDGGWIAMLVTGVVVLLLAAPLGRATWAVYGVAGAYAPLVHYIVEGGGDLQVPLALVFVSLGIVALGIVTERKGAAWRASLRERYRL